MSKVNWRKEEPHSLLAPSQELTSHFAIAIAVVVGGGGGGVQETSILSLRQVQ